MAFVFFYKDDTHGLSFGPEMNVGSMEIKLNFLQCLLDVRLALLSTDYHLKLSNPFHFHSMP